MGSDTRPERSHKGDSGKRAARSCTKPTLGHNFAFFIRPRVPWSPSHDTTRPDPTRLHGHPHTTRPDPARTKFGVSMGARPARTKLWGFRGRTTPMKARGSMRKTGHMNVQKTHGQSRLSIFGTATCARAPTHGTTRPGLVRAHPTRPNVFAQAPTHDTT